MEISILTFGQITGIIGKEQLTWKDVPDTDTLQQALYEQYPALKTTKYTIAVNKQVIKENTILEEHATVALLPPFSGG